MSNRLGSFLAYLDSPPESGPTTPSNSVTTSNPRFTSAAQYILNDTSLAAVHSPSGDRQLFFQDNNGSIRRAIRTASDEPWVISPYFNLSASSKKHTPLAATFNNDAEANDADANSNVLTTVNICELYRSHAR